MELFNEWEYETAEEFNEAWDTFSYDLRSAINDNDGIYVIIGNFGRWDGPVHGGAIIKSYDDLIKFLSFRGDHYDTFKDEKGEFLIDQSHHDGSNHYKMRMLTKKGLTRYWNHMSNVGKVDGELLMSLENTKEYTRKANIGRMMGYL